MTAFDHRLGDVAEVLAGEPDNSFDARLFCGDCRELLQFLPDSSVDLILTDPPYFRVKGEAWDRQWDNPAKYLEWLDGIAAQWFRVLKPNGSLYCFAGPRMAARVEVMLARRFNIIQRITWRKPPFSTKAEMRDKESLRMFFPASEAIIFCEHYGADNIAKGESGYGAKCDELRGFVFEPLRAYLAGEVERAGLTVRQVAEAFQEKTGSRTVTGMAGHWLMLVQWELPTAENYQWLRELLARRGRQPALPYEDYHAAPRNRFEKTPAEYEYLRAEYEYLRAEYEDLRAEYEDLRAEYEDLRRPFNLTADVPYTDVWDFPTVNAYPGKHPCEKPQALLQHIITVSTRPGALVLDCFAGSGSAGRACLELGRRFIGIEKNPEYLRRWAEHGAEGLDPAVVLTEGQARDEEKERGQETLGF